MKTVIVSGTAWTKDAVKALLSTNDKAVCKGILRIYEHQTADERATSSTTHDNGVGFSGFDARILSSFAKQLLNNHTLTPKQMDVARSRTLKYAGQLLYIMSSDQQKQTNLLTY